MTYLDVIKACERAGIRIGVRNGRLLLRDEQRKLDEDLRGRLSEHKAQIIEWLQAQQAKDAPITPRPADLERIPLSYAQRRLWFAEMSGAGDGQYNVPMALRVEGTLDPSVLQAVLGQLVQRHEILRSVYRSDDDEPYQVVLAARAPEVVQLGEHDSPQAVQAAIRDFSRQPFNLAKDLMLRCGMLRDQDGVTVLLFVLHHIACDGWSMPLVTREFLALYEGQGRSDVLAPLEVQYADYAYWQRQVLPADSYHKALSYWRGQLADAPSVHALPLDHQRPAVPKYVGEVAEQTLPRDLVDQLKALGQAHNASLFMVLYAAYVIALAKLGRARDVVVGVPSAGRDNPQLAKVVGFFVNTLPLRMKVDESHDFATFLEHARQCCLDAFANDVVPFDLLVEEMAGQRSASYAPLCQLTFTMNSRDAGARRTEARAQTSPGPRLSRYEAELDIIKFDMELAVTEHADGALVLWRYARDLFERESVDTLSALFEAVLRQAVADPTVTLADCASLSPAQAAQVLAWGRGIERDQALVSVPTQFLAQAAATPDHVAVRGPTGALTYAQLAQRSARLAHALGEQEIGAGDRVGVYLPGSGELLIALLGIQRAGAAYVPMDPATPPARVRQTLDCAAIDLVLSVGEYSEDLTIPGVDVLYLDHAVDGEDWLLEFDQARDDTPLPAQALDAPSYVIFTSGSTGRPKGVEISHAAFADYCRSAQSSYYEASLTGALVVTSPAFDITVPSLYLPLLDGGCVQFPAQRTDLGELAAAIVACERTLVRMTPTHVRGLLPLLGAADEYVNELVFVVGGEAFPATLAEALQACFPRARIYNHYGPTEATVGCSIHRYTGARAHGSTLPIGRPFANTSVYVLDDNGALCPPGVPGELHIAGAGLAVAYVADPTLTAERFVDDAFGSGRAYRSGDLVRWLANGELEFLRRVDEQLKVRGFRVEPREIEGELTAVEGVAQAAVVASEDATRLLAYAAVDPARRPACHRLLTQLQAGTHSAERVFTLANGMDVHGINRAETEYLYGELMCREEYLRGPIRLGPGDCIFDVGANIGMFSLALLARRQKLQIFAYEPVPEIFAALQANGELYGEGHLHVQCLGLSDEVSGAEYHYYPHATVFSGVSAAHGANAQKVRGFLGEQLGGEHDGLVEEMIRDRLETVRTQVELSTLSEQIRAHGIRSIDLLKIDVERNELKVLAGIEAAHWPLIKQVVIECEDRDGQAEQVRALLRKQGYAVCTEQAGELAGTDLVNVYAVRGELCDQAASESRPAAIPSAWLGRAAIESACMGACERGLADYMVPAGVLLLAELPRLGSGKLDRSALPAWDPAQADGTAPSTATEQVLADIWRRVLGVERFGVTTSFFSLGGHSLLATRVISDLAATLGKRLPVRAVFEHKTIRELAAAVDQLPTSAGCRAIEALPAHAPKPLSYQQQRLWFIDQLDGSTHYNVPVALVLRGALDVHALERSLDAIVRRHHVLRTVFERVDEVPVARCLESWPTLVTQVDLRHHHGKEAEVRRRLRAELGRPFALDRDVMLRVLLLRRDDDDQVLLFTMHHIASDGWSIGLLIKEFVGYYEAYRAGDEPAIAPLPVQYADYAHWQRDELSGEALEGHLGYWRERLKGLPQVHQLALDRPRPAQQGHAAGVVEHRIPVALVERLRTFGEAHDASLFMVLEAVLAVLLSRYSHSRDIVIGTPTAGRVHKDVEPLIGFFINNLVLRTELEEGSSFVQVLAQVRERALEAYAHEMLPFEMLVEALSPERDLRYSPLFQIKFVLQNYASGRLQLPGLQIEPVAAVDQVVHFDLDLTATETPDGLSLVWMYKEELFEQATIEGLAQAFDRLLWQVLGAPNAPVESHRLLSDDESRAQLARGRGPQVLRGRDSNVVADFVARAARRGDAVAVRGARQTLTYAQLDRASNRLADYLLEQDIGRGSRVGVFDAGGVELLVCILGVLKSGASYVPVDPHSGSGRARHALGDAEVSLVLTTGASLAELDVGGIDVLQVEECTAHDWLSAYSSNAPAVPIRGTDEAYVIYTSGSTGTAKGVAVNHAALQDYCAFALGNYYEEGLSGSLVATSPAFDITVPSLYLPLLSGGTVSFLDRSEVIGALSRCLQEALPTQRYLLRLTPTHVAELLHRLEDERLASRRDLWVIGGERLDRDVASALLQRSPQARVFNHYGPTETVVGCALYEVSAHGPGTGASVPIGQAMENTCLYVLDPQGELVPEGVPGELYIGGPCVTGGYLNAPEQTARQFVTTAWSGEARVYRSGDRVRWRGDGALEYLGRVDRQLKVRGHRVEPGEIESALRAQAGINEAVVVLLGEGAHSRLVAYLVSDEEPDETQLRAALRTQLADYLVPGQYVRLQTLPRLGSGKVDYASLPSPSALDVAQMVEPRTALERSLARIWCEVLGLEEVSVRASFFALGGHSLLATRVVSAVAKELDLTISLRTLFEHTTVAELARHLTAQEESGGGSVRRIAPRDPAQAVPLSFAQQRIWFVHQLDEGGAQFNIPRMLRLTGTLHRAALEGAFESLRERHESLRTLFVERDGAPEQVVRAAPGEVLEYLDLCAEPDPMAAAREYLQAASARPFDLTREHALRVTLLRLSDEEHVLLLLFHHIVFDEWSTGVLTRELGRTYDQMVKGEYVPAPPLPVQYGDYAVWQRGDQPRLEGDLDYWRGQLEATPPLHSLPLDGARPRTADHAGASFTRRLDGELQAQLEALAASHDTTLFVLMESMFALLVGRFSHSDDVVVGTPVSGRGHPDVDDLIGFFVNTLVLRSSLDQRLRFDEFLQANARMIVEAQAHQTAPFERVVDALGPQRILGATPIFQIMFALQARAGEGLQLDGLQVAPLGTGFEVAKFDLRVTVHSGGHGLGINWLYATRLFEASTIERLADCYEQLLRAVLAQPHAPIHRLPLTESGEEAWLRGQEDPVAPLAVPPQLREQAARVPDARAVSDGAGSTLSYRALLACADELTVTLRDHCHGAEPVVLICLPRTIELAVAVVAVMQARAAFVIVDPDYPMERIALLAQDSDACAMVADPARFAGACGATPVLPAPTSSVNHAPSGTGAGVQLDALAQRLCYLAYTSGTSGRPKGVAVEHRALAAYLQDARQRYYGDALAGAVLVGSPAFDLSLPSLLLPLLTGGTLVLLPGDDPIAELAALLNVTDQSYLLRMTPTHLRAVLPLLRANAHAQHSFVVGGEALPWELVSRLRRCYPRSALFNHYGPTEAVIGSTLYEVNADTHERITVPIGRPFANTQILLLDRGGQCVPRGAIGEIHIAGESLARCYFADAALTQEQFLAPSASLPRRYRTGDLGRVNEAGELEFLGRHTAQLKLRGFRIEPGEIEAALLEHEGVGDAVVTVVRVGDADLLVAYLSAREAGDAAPDLDALRASLRARLPAYMVPSRYCVLDAIPQTANGKVNRRALPSPDANEQEHVAPEGHLETVLAEVWAHVLERPQVSVTADFFELGGHSLLATRVMTALHHRTHIRLPVRAIFEHPTVRTLAAEAASVGAGHSEVIPKVDRREPIPLSYGQQRLWFIDQLNGSSTQYNQTRALRLRGTLDRAALRSALNALVQRHEALRTRFAEHEGAGVQVVGSGAEVGLRELDWRADQPGAQDVAAWLRRERGRAFDLRQDLMLRASLLRLGEDEHLLVLTVHHIASDGWSTGILVREFMHCYSAYASGSAPHLAQLEVQYADLAAWQRQRLSSKELAQQMEFWLRTLEGIPATHAIPLDAPRPATPDYRAGLYTSRVDQELLDQLNALARGEGASLFMLLQACFGLFLGRYGASDDVVVGTPVAGRDHVAAEGVVGHFLNNLVFRTRLEPGLTGRRLIQQTRAYALDAFANQTLPFESLVDALQPPRQLGVSPVFQIKFVLQNYSVPDLTLPQLEVSPVVSDDHVVHFDLDLTATERPGGLALQWTYRQDLFAGERIEQMAGSFVHLLRQLVADPEREVYAYALADPTQCKRLQLQVDGAGASLPLSTSVLGAIARQVDQAPERCAVRAEDMSLSYAELDERARRLAAYLRENELGAGDVIGLIVSRSAKALVAILGVWKCGAAYVPLDPAAGRPRIQQIIEDAGIDMLIGESAFLPGVPVAGMDTLSLDECAQDDWLAAYGRGTQATRGADSLAYVIYTSGSTGRPKGVEVEDAALADYCVGAAATYYTELDGAAVLTSMAFDLSLPSVLLPLMHGHCVHLPAREADLADCAAFLAEHRDRLLVRITPSYARGLLDVLTGPESKVSHTFVIGGEALTDDLLTRLQARFPESAFYNHYGPTEAVIGCTLLQCPAGTHWGERVPIGRPFPTARVRVMEAGGTLAAPGGVGELWVAGPGLARAYRGDSALTSERFVSWPADGGERHYRTGDRVRWRSDGTLEFLGRLDDQLKVRGHRVEPAELAAHIRTSAEVSEVLVNARVQDDDVRLVAYVQASPEADLDGLPERILRACSQLPDYLRPQAVMVMDAWPLTANGKVDRARLPDSQGASVTRERVAPQSDLERELLRIWGGLLRHEEFGVTDDFFLLGGHSLLATRMVSEVRAAGAIELPLKDVFELRTIRALAQKYEGELALTAMESALDEAAVTEEGWL